MCNEKMLDAEFVRLQIDLANHCAELERLQAIYQKQTGKRFIHGQGVWWPENTEESP